MRRSCCLALLCVMALLSAAGTHIGELDDVLDSRFWAENARWLRNGGNFRSAERCELARRRLSAGQKGEADGTEAVDDDGSGGLSLVGLWSPEIHSELLNTMGVLLERFSPSPRCGQGALHPAKNSPSQTASQLLSTKRAAH
jgi:hypothetical protein